MSIADPLDGAMRQAAIVELERRAAGRPLDADDLGAGFQFRGERIPFVNPQRGIFKPRIMPYLLSIRTVFPRTGARVWYDDQRRVHQQIHSGEELIDYAFMGSNPDAADNRWLREAMEAQVPIIYFLGIAPGRYTAIYPTFIADWSARELTAKIGFGVPLVSTLRAGENSAGTRASLCAPPRQPAPTSGHVPRSSTHSLWRPLRDLTPA